MSGASSQSNVPTSKLQDTEKDKKGDSSATKEPQKTPATLEEDDEFEDFPVEDWGPEDTEVPGGNTHLWEESWDDDDTSEDFSKQLKEELEKVRGSSNK
ncbi:26S proteasome complex subunit [Thelotrema lepadinum]|nr:26S proteasome complex subunit [Thelotrema lepadinum]